MPWRTSSAAIAPRGVATGVRVASGVAGVVGITGHAFGRRGSAAEVPPTACSDGIVLRGMPETDADSRVARAGGRAGEVYPPARFRPSDPRVARSLGGRHDVVRLRKWKRRAVPQVGGRTRPCGPGRWERRPAVRRRRLCPRRQPIRRFTTRGCCRRPDHRRATTRGCGPSRGDGRPCRRGGARRHGRSRRGAPARPLVAWRRRSDATDDGAPCPLARHKLRCGRRRASARPGGAGMNASSAALLVFGGTSGAALLACAPAHRLGTAEGRPYAGPPKTLGRRDDPLMPSACRRSCRPGGRPRRWPRPRSRSGPETLAAPKC